MTSLNFKFRFSSWFDNTEYRWTTLGLVESNMLLLVVHDANAGSDGTETVRIVSVRRAALKERKRYEQNYSLHY